MKILLSSVGRRPYLVRWFQEALTANHVRGVVIAADSDPTAPAGSFADQVVRAPRADDPGYQDWLATTLQRESIDLAISINDFELSTWATLPAKGAWEPLVRLNSEVQAVVEDKYQTSLALDLFDVPSPATWLGSSPPDPEHGSAPFVTKGRYGSASRGLRFVNHESLAVAIADATSEVTTRQGNRVADQSDVAPEDFVVVQEKVAGVEYGLDVVCDFEGDYVGVLARRKISMRAGETDRAVSVDTRPFELLARGIASALPHPGTFDVDVIVSEDGRPSVIDINPRFGGGYPFSHLAGARIPHIYVAWALGREANPAWLHAQAGVTAGKYVEITTVPHGRMA